MTKAAGKPVNVVFTPHLIPMSRGIIATVYAPLVKPMTAEEVKATEDLTKPYYADASWFKESW